MYASSGVQQQLNWNPSKIEGQSIDIIIPQPFQSIHNQLVSSGQGKLFKRRKFLKIFALNKQKNLINTEIKIQSQYSVSKGLFYLDIFQFKVTNDDFLDQNFIVNEENEIVEMEKKLKKNFEIGMKLSQISTQLNKAVQDTRAVLAEQMGNKGFTFELNINSAKEE